ncbi:hypothetical protein NDU88_000985 [Pleurodeles waltl]|uniref:Uncharacterized protein n=1 Tax=Pleurodeles waltl TaxID=8319 RepID=A0AAV7NBB1_PLEWA|nr:hypothetical protein NDU88_000985 [Pleurodeles waltl]
MLAVRIKEKSMLPGIRERKDAHGALASDQDGILEAFRRFYERVYREKKEDENLERDMMNFFESVSFGRLSTEVRDLLEAPLTFEEVQVAIKKLPLGKAVGGDKIPLEFYTFI